MSIIDSLAKKLGYSKKIARRSYHGSKINHLTGGMPTMSLPPDAEIRRSLRILRARSRDLAQNSDHMRRFLSMLKTNVIGHNGIVFQSRIQDARTDGLDQIASDAVEKSFYRWRKFGKCDVTGRHSFNSLCRVIIETVARDGECFIRKHSNFDGAPALELIDSEAIDIDYNVWNPAVGNKIVMGVEVDEWGRHIAYHTRTNAPDSYSYGGRKYKRIPAGEILHISMLEHAQQTRSVPWVSSAMLRLGMLGGYEEAELTAARIGASKMGFFTESMDSAGYNPDEINGQLISNSDPGTFEKLPVGVGFEAFDPQHPTSAYGTFVKECLRGISSGLGVSYNSLANDLEGVNFSSLRQGAIDERNTWMMLQEWIIEQFCEPVFHWWLPIELLHGIPTKFGGNLRAADVERYSSGSWQPRRWQWVDPLKEIKAHKEAVELGVRSKSEIIREQGRDPIDVWREIQRDNEIMDSMGINLATEALPVDISEDEEDVSEDGE